MNSKGLTQQQAADQAGVSQTAVAKWLHGSVPRAGELFNFAKANGVNVEWFFEAIPYQKDEKALRLPIAKAPASAIPPEIRHDVAAGIEVANDPELAKAFEEAWRTFLESKKKLRSPKNKVLLDNTAAFPKDAGVKEIRSLSELLDAVRRLTKARGKKVELARFVGVTRQAVDQWLSGLAKPSAETTFALLDWVRKQSGNQT